MQKYGSAGIDLPAALKQDNEFINRSNERFALILSTETPKRAILVPRPLGAVAANGRDAVTFTVGVSNGSGCGIRRTD